MTCLHAHGAARWLALSRAIRRTANAMIDGIPDQVTERCLQPAEHLAINRRGLTGQDEARIASQFPRSIAQHARHSGNTVAKWPHTRIEDLLIHVRHDIGDALTNRVELGGAIATLRHGIGEHPLQRCQRAQGILASRLLRQHGAHFIQRAFHSAIRSSRDRIATGVRDQCSRRDERLTGEREQPLRVVLRRAGRCFRGMDDQSGIPCARCGFTRRNRSEARLFHRRCNDESRPQRADDRRCRARRLRLLRLLWLHGRRGGEHVNRLEQHVDSLACERDAPFLRAHEALFQLVCHMDDTIVPHDACCALERVRRTHQLFQPIGSDPFLECNQAIRELRDLALRLHAEQVGKGKILDAHAETPRLIMRSRWIERPLREPRRDTRQFARQPRASPW